MISDDDLFVRRDPISWMIAISLVTHLVAFCLPVFQYECSPPWGGFRTFMLLLGLLFVGLWLWLAFPAYWLTLWFLARQWRRGAIISAIAATFVAVSPLPIPDWRLSLKVGYYLWLTSCILLLMAACVVYGRESKSSIANLFACDPKTIEQGRENVADLPTDEAEGRFRKEGGPKES